VHAVHPAVLQKRGKLWLVKLEVVQVFQKGVVSGLQGFDETDNVLWNIQRKVFDVDVK
jgi:hypothetical protein